MSWWRKALLWFSRFTLRTAVLLAVVSVALVSLVGTPQNIKTFVGNSGAYEQIVGIVLEETAQQDEVEPQENSIPLEDKKIRQLAEQTFPPERLKEIFEKMVDGTYRWLDGEVPQPDFTLDLSGEKRAIAKGVSQQAKERVSNLPACTSLPKTNDPFELDCRPPNLNLNQEAAKIEQQLLKEDGFLKDTTITFADFAGQDTNQEDLDRIASGFQRFLRMPLILSMVAVVAGAAILFLAKSKRAGIERVGKILLSSGIFLAITTLVFGKLLPALSPSLRAQFKDGSFAGILNSVFTQTLDFLVKEMLIYSGVVIVLGAVLLLVLRFTKPRNQIIKPQK